MGLLVMLMSTVSLLNEEQQDSIREQHQKGDIIIKETDKTQYILWKSN